MDEKLKKRLLKYDADYRLYHTINEYGIKKTKVLLKNFLIGEALELDDDTGYILSMFIGFYNNQNNNFSDGQTIAAFIGYSQYRWSKKKANYIIENDDDSDERQRFKKFTDTI